LRRAAIRCLAAAALAAAACGGSRKAEPITNGSAAQPSALDPAKGHALLDGYFRVMRSVSLSGSTAEVLPLLDERLAAGVTVHGEGAISDDVFQRHQRLVEMTRKLFAAFDVGDEAKRAAMEAEVRAYVAGIEGGPGEVTGGATLAVVAPGLVAELANLHMDIDGVTDHAGQRAAYEKKYLEDQ
jgi:hypothetical protein